MGGRRPCFLALVLVLAILCASFSQGFARNIKIMGHERRAFDKALAEEAAKGRGRGMAQVGFSAMDYEEPGANTNPWAGWVSPPPGPQH